MNILSWFTNLKLSILQWALVTLGTAVGVLVYRFKVQGSQLHETQIKLLLATINQSTTLKEAAVVKAKQQLQGALKDYYAAKGGK